jgi:nitroreductase
VSALIDHLRARRSVRRYRDVVPERALVERLFEAAVTAPSASNRQPWRFFVVESKPKIAAMAAAVRAAVERIAAHVEPASEPAFRAYGDYFTRFEGAPLVVAPIFQGPRTLSHLVDERLGEVDRASIAAMERDSGLIGVSLALQNLLLMAPELGLGASAMTGPLVAAPELRAILEVPPSWSLVALVPLGYPDETPEATDRKPVERVVKWI